MKLRRGTKVDILSRTVFVISSMYPVVGSKGYPLRVIVKGEGLMGKGMTKKLQLTETNTLCSMSIFMALSDILVVRKGKSGRWESSFSFLGAGAPMRGVGSRGKRAERKVLMVWTSVVVSSGVFPFAK